MALIETPEMGDWLRIGSPAVIELLISYRVKSVCKLVALMKAEGQDSAPIFKEVVEMCRKNRARRRN